MKTTYFRPVLSSFAVLFCLAACSGSISAPAEEGGSEGEGYNGDEPILLEESDGGEPDGGDWGGDLFGDAERDAAPEGDLPPDTDCRDRDHDGFCSDVDCDDLDPLVNPGAKEICGNAIDDDCNGQADESCTFTRTFYVDKDSLGGTCSDSGPGTIDSPWCTVDKANSTLQPGDAVFIRAGEYHETIQPVNSGQSDSLRITYSAYGGEQVVLTQSTYCVRLMDKNYITIRGIKFYNCQRNLYLSNSSHNVIEDCEFDTPAGPATWAGSRVYNGSRYNRIVRCVFSRYGNESQTNGEYDDNGCVLDIGNDNREDHSDYNLISDCTFFYGGHHILGVYSNYNVVRRSTFHNEEWYPCHRAEIGGMCGNRNIILNTSIPQINIRNVIEDNYIVFSGVPPDQVASVGLSLRTKYNIVRRNIFYHNDSSGLALSADGGNSNDASFNYIYHNVFFHNGYLLLDDWNPRKNGLMLARWVDDAQHNPMVGVVIKNNIFYLNNLQAISYYYVNPAEQTVEGNWLEQGDPLFINASGTPDPSDFGYYDFHLQPDSPCIDGGVFLTKTLTAGTDSTTMKVEDAGYFSDGRGLVAGDIIRLQNGTATAMVIGVDYENNTLVLDTPLSWNAGDGVSLVYSGERPDQGVFEWGF